MLNNAEMIEMHLATYLHETGQVATIRWDAVLAYCIGYYDEITMDHIVAIRNLERLGYIREGKDIV